ncbi:MAG TPA: Flp pilus assembly protein CpaB [Tepidisphaeraceae bacterium]|nr:Flp pilus assembly protein CpaB [Tepidisphaeraceae bacterium]
MMNWKTWVPLAAAIVLGGIAAKVAHDMMTRGHASAPAQKVTQVVVAKTVVQPGQELTDDCVGLAAIAGPTAPANTFSTLSEVTGRVATAPLFPGQQIFEGALAPRGAIAGLAAMVPAGMRAITIDVNETSSLAGMLAPGSRVDVLTTITDGPANATSARTAVQNVLVQAVGQRLTSFHPAPDKNAKAPAPLNDIYRSVTLIVTPHQAETLQLVSGSTRMTLVLRGVGDDVATDEDPVTISELLGKSDQQVVVIQPAPATQPVIAPESGAGKPADPPPQPQPTTEKRVVRLIRPGGTTNIVFQIPRAPIIEAGGADDLFKHPIPSEQPEE